MSIYINLVSILIGLFIIIITFKNMIRKKITERQSFIWLLIGLFVIVLGVFPPLLKIVSDALGIWYAPAILFAVAFVGLLLIVYNHTVSISVMNNKIQELSLQLALLKQEHDEEMRIRKDMEPDGNEDALEAGLLLKDKGNMNENIDLE